MHTQQYIFSSSLFRLQTNPTSSPVHMENFLHHMSSMVPFILCSTGAFWDSGAGAGAGAGAELGNF